MSSHLAEFVVLGSQISLQNVSILASRAHNRLVPCNGAHSGEMATESPDTFKRRGVPDLSMSTVSSYGQVSSLFRP